MQQSHRRVGPRDSSCPVPFSHIHKLTLTSLQRCLNPESSDFRLGRCAPSTAHTRLDVYFRRRSFPRRRRSDPTFYFKQRQSHAPQCGAYNCQERIRQLVVFTPGSCPPQPGQPFRATSRAPTGENMHFSREEKSRRRRTQAGRKGEVQL